MEKAGPGHFWQVLRHSGQEKGGSLVMGWVPSFGHSGVLTTTKDMLDFRLFTEMEERNYEQIKLGNFVFLFLPLFTLHRPLKIRKFQKSLKNYLFFPYRTFKEVVLAVDIAHFESLWLGFFFFNDV